MTKAILDTLPELVRRGQIAAEIENRMAEGAGHDLLPTHPIVYQFVLSALVGLLRQARADENWGLVNETLEAMIHYQELCTKALLIMADDPGAAGERIRETLRDMKDRGLM